jgi:hypothetical protein
VRQRFSRRPGAFVSSGVNMVGTEFEMFKLTEMMKPVVTVEFVVLKKNMEPFQGVCDLERKTFVTTFF